MKPFNNSQWNFSIELIALIVSIAALAIALFSCTPLEEITPTPTCRHTLQWDDTYQRLHVDIISDLDHVTITRTAQGFEPLTLYITKEYFTCITLPLFNAETVVAIDAEEVCQYTF